MTPLRELLARIRWDPGFRRSRYEIAYLDHRRMGLVRAALDRAHIPAGGAFALELPDDEGGTRTIPLHRVREVRRDGKVIWSRLAPRAPPRASGPGPRRRSRTAAGAPRLPPRAAR